MGRRRHPFCHVTTIVNTGPLDRASLTPASTDVRWGQTLDSMVWGGEGCASQGPGGHPGAHHPKGFLEGEEGGGEGGEEKGRGEGCTLKPFSGTRAGSSMSREELGVLELRSWGSSWREVSSPGRLHEG